MALGTTKQDPSDTDGKKARKAPSRPKPGMADYIAGEAGAFVSELSPYLPQELIGGALPHIPGTEEEAVWNAASQACGTEKVHFCYSADAGRIWYLACPSTSLSSNPDSWCPLAAALPGNSEYWDQETVYLYEQEGLASALRWDPETHRMQVFLGASRTILPRIQSMDANFVTINPEVADIVPWENMNLKTEKLARATVSGLLLAGMLVFFAAALFLVSNFVSINFMERDLTSVKQETEAAKNKLIDSALKLKKTYTVEHMVNIQKLLDDLAKFDGTLVKYELDKGKLEWQVLVAPAFATAFIEKYKGAKTVEGTEKDGRIRIQGKRI